MKRTITVALTALVVAASIHAAVAQRMPGRGGRGAARMFDPAHVETIEGYVTAIDTMQSANRGMAGVHVTLKTSNESIPVHLGPSWYLNKQGIALKIGETVSVTGSRITAGGKPTIIAMRVTSGGKTIALRDSAGIPAWSRGGR